MSFVIIPTYLNVLKLLMYLDWYPENSQSVKNFIIENKDRITVSDYHTKSIYSLLTPIPCMLFPQLSCHYTDSLDTQPQLEI